MPVINFNQAIELIEKDATLKKMNFEISTFVETKINTTDSKFQENSIVYHKELQNYLKVVKYTAPETEGQQSEYKCEVVEQNKDEDN